MRFLKLDFVDAKDHLFIKFLNKTSLKYFKKEIERILIFNKKNILKLRI